MKGVAWLVLALLVVGIAQARVENFRYPSKTDEFCGVHINKFYCKCAFHDEYCGTVGSNQDDASFKVETEFKAFVKDRVERFAKNCMKRGGIYSVVKRHCTYCDAGEVRDNGVCVKPDDKRPVEDKYNLPDPSTLDTTGGSITPAGHVVSAEGEFFVYSPGLEKWIGPVREGRTLFPGDVLYTTSKGRAKIRLGNSNMIVSDRTMMKLPTKRKKRSVLMEGIVNIWENIKRIARNEPFEIEGGQSISGIKGTDFIIQVQDGIDKYAVKEGLVEVRNKNTDDVVEVSGGESIEVTEYSVEDAPYEWETLLEENGWKNRDLSEPGEVNLSPYPIDPNAVNPPEAAYTGDLAGDLNEKGGNTWMWIILLLLAGGGGYYWYNKR